MKVRDASQFYAWRRQMEIKDQQQLLQHRQKKKIEMELSKEAAIKACNQKFKNNKEMANNLKQQSHQMLKQKDASQKQDLEDKKKIVKSVHNDKNNAAKQKQKIIQKNKQIHDQEKQMTKSIMEKKKQQKQIEMMKKKELVREIRLYLEQPKNTAKIINFDETMGIGLLQQMSFVELKNRLREVQNQYKLKEEQKRRQILENKHISEKEKKLKLEKILQDRALLSQKREEQRRNRKKQRQEEQQKIQQHRIKSQNEFNERQKIKYQKKKQEKQQFDKQIKEISQKRQFMNENQAAVEQSAFKNLELGAQRQILERQNNKLIHKYRQQQANNKDKTILAQNRKKKVEAKMQFHKTYEKERQEANRVYEQLQNQDKLEKASKFQEVKTFQQKHSQSMARKMDYSNKVNSMGLTKSKAK